MAPMRAGIPMATIIMALPLLAEIRPFIRLRIRRNMGYILKAPQSNIHYLTPTGLALNETF
ncbi:exported hypothetical protein [Novosphingobium sp. KN65.2]|nr:exported hypothetical protein [Novosphingobium sp. KN65.2]